MNKNNDDNKELIITVPNNNKDKDDDNDIDHDQQYSSPLSSPMYGNNNVLKSISLFGDNVDKETNPISVEEKCTQHIFAIIDAYKNKNISFEKMKRLIQRTLELSPSPEISPRQCLRTSSSFSSLSSSSSIRRTPSPFTS